MLTDSQRKIMDEVEALLSESRWGEALARIDEAMPEMEGPWAARIFVLRARALAGQGKDDEATRAYMTAYSVLRYGPPDDPYIQLTLGQAAEGAGEIQEAIAAYRNVLQVDPDSVEAREGLERLGA